MEKWYDSDFAFLSGVGIIIFMACLGVGTCCKLSYLHKEYDGNSPTVEKVEKETK